MVSYTHEERPNLEAAPASPSRRNFFNKVAVGIGTSSSALAAGNAQADESNNPQIGKHLHILRRTTLGVTPELVTEIKAIGNEAFIERQLNPAAIDDSELENILDRYYPTLKQSPRERFDTRTQEVILLDIPAVTVLRALHSHRQLQEVMVDFWSNHFNIDMTKDWVCFQKIEQDAQFRRFALGKFSDLLMASAKSGSMMEYLDNDKSQASYGTIPNENYAREFMELHTLGVDGGYKEEDILNVAYVMSGWSSSHETFTFKFNRHHNSLGPKLVKGANILGWRPVARGGSIRNGESLVRFLARHRSTARFICWKLCRYFVDDTITANDPLVKSAARTFLKHDTAIAPVLRTILYSNRFNQAKGQKVKRGNEIFYSMLRATNTSIDLDRNLFLTSKDLVTQLGKLNHRLFEYPQPNGYPLIAAEYLDTNAMSNRWNFGFALMANTWTKRFRVDINQLIGPRPAKFKDLINQLSIRLLGHRLSSVERQAIYSYLGKQANDQVKAKHRDELPIVAGLILATPSFQLR